MSKTITIDELIPLLNDGYVAMDVNGNWWWYQTKPVAYKRRNCWMVTHTRYMKLNTIEMKDIAPFEGDWKDSLRRIK